MSWFESEVKLEVGKPYVCCGMDYRIAHHDGTETMLTAFVGRIELLEDGTLNVTEGGDS